MQVTRDPLKEDQGGTIVTVVRQSPPREIYGRLGNQLLTSIDICFLEQGNTQPTPMPSGLLLGVPVRLTTGTEVGVIADYDWPPADMMDLNPVVRIDAQIDISAVPEGAAAQARVSVGDELILCRIDGPNETPLAFQLTLTRSAAPQPYPLPSMRATAYLASCDPVPARSLNGARVRVRATGELLGMLMTCSDGGTAVIYPAHLIR
jgi:hypothetical protein